MKEEYADIIIDISHEKLDKTFQYRVPEQLVNRLEPGMCVQVPFGKSNRLIKGYVMRISEHSNFDPERTKEIAQIAERDVSVEDTQIRLAGWIRRQYGSTMIQALKTVLPAKQSVGKLEYKFVELLMGREELTALLGESIRKKQTAKARLLEALLAPETEGSGAVPLRWITGKLNVSSATVNSLVKAGAVRVTTTESFRNPVKLAGIATGQPQGEPTSAETVAEGTQGGCAHVLSEEQSRIVKDILGDFDRGAPGTYLIHGITGSGKTEVYMALIEAMIDRGKQSIVLIPEIALSYQTLLRFYRRFGDRVSVMNSTLSPGEKYDQCERAKRGEIDVIIGPRSALFTPFPRIGLIVIDEEHEGSYKSEGTPKYHARETAMEVARLHGAGVVLGSATPSLESYYRAQTGEYKLYRLTRRLTGGVLAQVQIVDLREELKQGNRSIFSRKLQELLRDRLEKGQQSMLFLNRRGYAGFISCRACGHVMKCPHCDVSLSEHKNGRLICHYCGYSEPKVTKCPQCGSKYILGFRAGTQQIEEKLKELFPEVRTLRMDGDTTRNKGSYEKILTSFADGEADVLIGTQMIVKGHDFPNVTLVGVLAADLSLAAGDFRAGERTFQLLTQAVGRAGRGNLAGEAVIQTYQPEHYAVVHAAEQNYEEFYQEEILYRELPGYPPVAHMLAVQIFHESEQEGWNLAGRLADKVRKADEEHREKDKTPLMILGPAPASIGKIQDVYRFVFYLKHAQMECLLQAKAELEDYIDRNGLSLKRDMIQFDMDPVHFM